MKKYIILAAAAAMVLASCENVETPGPVPSLEGFLLLNNGKMGSVFCMFIHMPKCVFHLEKKVAYPQISSSTSK